MKFSLAHFSDVHLGPLPRAALTHHPAFKKVIGAASWHFNRRFAHLPKIAENVRADILAARPDHIAFTGDLVNISAHQEFNNGQDWLKPFGAPDSLSYTPGNHDAYVPVPWDQGLGQFAPFMTNENPKDLTFPFIRLRRNIALIGLNGACPQSIFRAGGTIGAAQLAKLAKNLKALKDRGFYRAVMIHHPPAPGLTHPVRSLSDAAALQSILEHEGAELVIHGHNHTRSLSYLEGKSGRIPVVGVPSASMKPSARHPGAAWNLYEIERVKSQWQTNMKIRQWDASSNSMVDGDQLELGSNAA